MGRQGRPSVGGSGEVGRPAPSAGDLRRALKHAGIETDGRQGRPSVGGSGEVGRPAPSAGDLRRALATCGEVGRPAPSADKGALRRALATCAERRLLRLCRWYESYRDQESIGRIVAFRSETMKKS